MPKIYKYSQYIPYDKMLNLPKNYIFNDKLVVFNGLTTELDVVGNTNKNYHSDWNKLLKHLSSKSLGSIWKLIGLICVDPDNFVEYDLDEPNKGNLFVPNDSINYLNAYKAFYSENPIELTYKIPYHDRVPDEYDEDCIRTHGITAQELKQKRLGKYERE